MFSIITTTKVKRRTVVCAVYGPNTVPAAIAKRWLKRFRSRKMYVKNEARSNSPIV